METCFQALFVLSLKTEKKNQSKKINFIFYFYFLEN